MPSVGILVCGRNREEWIAEHGDFADWIPPFLRRVDGSLTFRVFQAHEGQLPAYVTLCDAWVLTGSPLSVYDNHPWQADLTDFVVGAARHRPLVGICYGHQHLHAAFGGTVERGAQWGVGIERYGLIEPPEWLPAGIARDSSEGFRLIALHQDTVSKPAPDSRVLAGNAACPAAVTTIGDNIFTFQAHPEMAPSLAHKIYDLHRDAIGAGRAGQAQQSLAGARDDLLASRWVIAFLQHHLERRGGARVSHG